MNFLVESDISWCALNKIIFEYLNFRPFLEELLDVTNDIKKFMNECTEANLSYISSYIINGVKWKIGSIGIIKRDHLLNIHEKRSDKLGIKSNWRNFRYHHGMNLCYMRY